MESEAQKRANKKWKAKNRKKMRLYRNRSSAKKYVHEETSKNRLLDLQMRIIQRLKEL